jgi:hypothetical protein
MKRSKDYFTFLFWAGISAAVFAGALVLRDAGISWLFRASVLAAALAMIMSSTDSLIFDG